MMRQTVMRWPCRRNSEWELAAPEGGGGQCLHCSFGSAASGRSLRASAKRTSAGLDSHWDPSQCQLRGGCPSTLGQEAGTTEMGPRRRWRHGQTGDRRGRRADHHACVLAEAPGHWRAERLSQPDQRPPGGRATRRLPSGLPHALWRFRGDVRRSTVGCAGGQWPSSDWHIRMVLRPRARRRSSPFGESGAAAVELAVLGHDPEEQAGGPAEGEETRHGDIGPISSHGSGSDTAPSPSVV